MKPVKNLVDLAEVLVPEQIRTNAPQYYSLIEAFLANIQDVQDSINSNYLDVIDYDRIKNTDFKKLYLDVFIKTLEIDTVDNIDSLGDIILVSKNLSTLKGTAVLYQILLNLLTYILPGVSTQYNELLQQYNEVTDEILKAQIERELTELKNNNLNKGEIEIVEYFDEEENIIPFQYTVIADVPNEIYLAYLRKFCHPAGWLVDFIYAIKRLTIDTIYTSNTFTLWDAFVWPIPKADGSLQTNDLNDIYPDYIYTKQLMGADTDYNAIASKLTDPSKLVIEGSELYYYWDLLSAPEETIGTIETDAIDVRIKSPVYDDISLTAGGYSGDTSSIGTANGSLSAGMLTLTYQILYQYNR